MKFCSTANRALTLTLTLTLTVLQNFIYFYAYAWLKQRHQQLGHRRRMAWHGIRCKRLGMA